MAVAIQSFAILRRFLLAEEGGDDHHIDFNEDPFMWTVFFCGSIGLCLMAGLMSGLTLGLMSIDKVDIEVLKRSGTVVQQGHAAAISPVIENQHLLLVTLLLGNAIAAEGLPLCIDRLADPITAVLVSVSVVLIFGEILPQAVCQRYGLMVGAYSAWFVRAIMVLFFPVSWPISKLLDRLLGTEHSALFRRAQLKALVDVHGADAGFGGTLTVDECNVIRGALDMTTKTASQAMTPLDKTFMLSTSDIIDERILQAILSSGHSRIPVFRGGNRQNVIGVMLAKELVMIDPEDMVQVAEIQLRQLPALSFETSLYDMLRLFETGKSHMALLVKPDLKGLPSRRHAASYRLRYMYHQNSIIPPGGKDSSITPLIEATEEGSETIGGLMDCSDGEVVGIITIEDVIEELLQEEILDETDFFMDNMQTSRVNAAQHASTLAPRIRQVLNGGHFTPRVGRLGMPMPKMPTAHTIDASALAAGKALQVKIKKLSHLPLDSPLHLSPRKAVLAKRGVVTTLEHMGVQTDGGYGYD